MTVQEFIKEENNKTWTRRKLGIVPDYYSTKDLSLALPASFKKKEFVVRTSVLYKILISAFLIFAFMCWLIILRLVLQDNLVWVSLAFLLFVSSIICFTVWNTFFNPNYVYTIRLNATELTIGKHHFNWLDVTDTYIMIYPEGRGRNDYLVVFSVNGEVAKFSLFQFNISNRKLSSLMEFYKTKKNF